ncbi:ATP-binding protein [Vibrio lamellibrachiae]|uniref:ATP-binding protein n=1 Tax=Vibrio lamellibrachiae TaxID=2910253 RepID=UPI003D1470B1
MSPPNQAVYHGDILGEDDVYHIASISKSISTQIGFSSFDSGLMSIAVSEVAMNVIRHAKCGVVSIKLTGNKKGVEVTIEDKGPGIENIKEAMSDGFSSYGSMGMGLGASQRSVDELKFNKHDSTGTSITLKKYLPVPEDYIDISVISSISSPYLANGDKHHVFKYNGDKVLLAFFEYRFNDLGEDPIQVRERNSLIKSNLHLPLDRLMDLTIEFFSNATNLHDIKISLFRLTPNTIEYSTLGLIDIFDYPNQEFNTLKSSHLNEDTVFNNRNTTTIKRPKSFCFVIQSQKITHKGLSSLTQ